MDYYKLSEEPLAAAKANKDQGLYRMSVSMATLAIDLLLKSVVHRIESAHDLIMGHNHAGMVTFVETIYPKKDKIRHAAKLSRKYFNASRYSRVENLALFSEELADEFICYAELIKEYVDNDCQATIEDLQTRFSKQH